MNLDLPGGGTETVSKRKAILPGLVACPWCDTPFRPGVVGAHRKRFCCNRCKDAYHSALRKWAQREMAQDRVTFADLKAV